MKWLFPTLPQNYIILIEPLTKYYKSINSSCFIFQFDNKSMHYIAIFLITKIGVWDKVRKIIWKYID